jgi:hypothetical protein
MKAAVQALLLAASLITTPGAAAPVSAPRAGIGDPAANKDPALEPADAEPAPGATIDVAQAFAPPDHPGGFDGGGPMRRPFGAFFAGRVPMPAVPRQACLEQIDRHAAIAGYIRSKLQLTAEQKEAWRKIEEAAEPQVQALRAVCAQLPDRPDMRPTLPELIDIAEKAVTTRAALLHAIREPVRHLYDLLTPDQRAALVPPMLPPHGGL